MARPINLPEGANFSCESCGRCCTGWAIPVDEVTVERLRRHDWGTNPFERDSGDKPYRIKLVDGRCFFLDAQNRCRIQSEISYEAKPAACRAFPLGLLEIEGERYARLSFWCPTVSANRGKPLEEQSRWLKEIAKEMDRRTAPFRINDQTSIEPRELAIVHAALRRFLFDNGLPMADRLAASAALISRIDQAAQKGGKFRADGLVRAAEADGIVALAAETRGGTIDAAVAPLFLLFLCQDCSKGHFAVFVHFVAVTLFYLGASKLYSRTMQARANLPQLLNVAFDPPIINNELLTRYFCSKLDSWRYQAGEATLVTGFNLLVAAYAIINVLSRIRAASARRSTCSDDDVRRAVEAADLLVIEHSPLFQGKVSSYLVNEILRDPTLCTALLHFVGHLSPQESPSQP